MHRAFVLVLRLRGLLGASVLLSLAFVLSEAQFDTSKTPGEDGDDACCVHAGTIALPQTDIHQAASTGADAEGATEIALWDSRGIGAGGALFSPSMSPFDKNEIYMATDMGSVFATYSFGTTWKIVDFRQLQGGIDSQVRYTSDPKILYSINIANDLRTPVKSVDGGLTWAALPGDPTYQETFILYADPESADRVLLGNWNEIFFSSDGGGSFHKVYEASGDVGVHIAGVFWDEETIFIGTQHGLLISSDNGATFSLSAVSGIGSDEAMVSFAGAKEDGVVRCFAVTLGAADVWAGITGAELWEYRNIYRLDWGDSAWTPATTGIDEFHHPFFVGMSLNDVDVAYLAGGDIDTAFPIVYKTVDGGLSWQSVFKTRNNENIATGWMGYQGDANWWYPEYALGFAVSPVDSDLAVVTDLGAVHVTDNGGDNWRQAYVSPLSSNPEGAPTPKGRAYQGNGVEDTSLWQVFWADSETMIGAFTDIQGTRSTDGGKTWTHGESLGMLYNTTYHVVEPAGSGTLYAAASSVHDIYQSTRLEDDPIDDGEGAVLMSEDKGASWRVSKDFGAPVVWLATDPSNADALYASVVHSVNGGVYRTTNASQGASATWTRLAIPSGTQGHPFNIRVLNDGTLICTYSGRIDASGAFTQSSGLFASTDGGASWQNRSHENMSRWTKDVVIDPHDADQNTWYVSVFSHWGHAPNEVGGLYRTRDRGETWHRISDLYRVESVAIDPDDPDVAYLATETQGLFRSGNLTDDNPVFTQVLDYPFSHPVRLFYNPYDNDEIWASSFGNGLRVFKDFSDARKLYYPLVRSGNSWTTEICVINDHDAESLDGVVIGYDADGIQMAPAVDVCLDANGRFATRVADSFPNAEKIAYAVFYSYSANAKGYASLTKTGSYRVSTPAISRMNSGDIHLSHIASSDQWSTEIALLNTTSEAISPAIRFSSGETRQISLSPMQQVSFSIADLFDGEPQPTAVSATIENAAGLVGLEIFADTNRTIAEALNLTDELSDEILFPHIATKDDWGTGIVAYNPADTPVSLTISPYTAQGDPLRESVVNIEPKSKYIGVVSVTLDLPENSEWMSLSASNEITGFELFTKSGMLGGCDGIGISGTAGLFPKIEKQGATGIALLNTSGQNAFVTLTAFNDQGEAIATESLTIPPFSKHVAPVHRLFSQNVSGASYVKFVSTEKIAAFSLNATDDNLLLDGIPRL